MIFVGRPAIFTDLSRVSYPLDLLLCLVVAGGAEGTPGPSVERARAQLSLRINVMAHRCDDHVALLQAAFAQGEDFKLALADVSPAGGVVEFSPDKRFR